MTRPMAPTDLATYAARAAQAATVRELRALVAEARTVYPDDASRALVEQLDHACFVRAVEMIEQEAARRGVPVEREPGVVARGAAVPIGGLVARAGAALLVGQLPDDRPVRTSERTSERTSARASVRTPPAASLSRPAGAAPDRSLTRS